MLREKPGQGYPAPSPAANTAREQRWFYFRYTMKGERGERLRSLPWRAGGGDSPGLRVPGPLVVVVLWEPGPAQNRTEPSPPRYRQRRARPALAWLCPARGPAIPRTARPGR